MDCARCYTLQREQNLKKCEIECTHTDAVYTLQQSKCRSVSWWICFIIPKTTSNKASASLSQMQKQKWWRIRVRYPFEDPMKVQFFLQSGLTEAKHHPHSLRLLKAETITALLMLCIWIALKQIYVLEKWQWMTKVDKDRTLLTQNLI